MASLLTKNPCIDVCKFDDAGLCKGCGRTREEKKRWKKLSDRDKHAIWMRILETHAPKGRKKARKLDKKRRKAECAAGTEAERGAGE